MRKELPIGTKIFAYTDTVNGYTCETYTVSKSYPGCLYITDKDGETSILHSGMIRLSYFGETIEEAKWNFIQQKKREIFEAEKVIMELQEVNY